MNVLRGVLLLAAAGMTACSGGGGRRADLPFGGRSIVLTDSMLACGGVDTIRFGRLHEGVLARRQVELRNDTQRPLVIRQWEASCGCVTTEYENQPLAPGTSRRMAVLFDARGEWGWQMKLLTLRFAGCEAPLKLYIEAEVE